MYYALPGFVVLIVGTAAKMLKPNHRDTVQGIVLPTFLVVYAVLAPVIDRVARVGAVVAGVALALIVARRRRRSIRRKAGVSDLSGI